ETARPPAPSEARGLEGSADSAFISLDDFRKRTKLSHDDLRLLAQVGALDSIAPGWTRPMLLWKLDAEENRRTGEWGNGGTGLRELPVLPFSCAPVPPPGVPPLKEYSLDRRRRTENELLGFTTDCHPMDLYADDLAQLRVVRSTELKAYVGKTVLCAGMLTTAKPVHTAKDEPMEFATFDDGQGLIEAVLFPDIYQTRGHVLFDQGPFVFQGKVEEEFGAVTFTITGLDRLDRFMRKRAWRLEGKRRSRSSTQSHRAHEGIAERPS
ncbi:MAG TPA: hypothetical protein VG817_12265, partial [Gemmatimonadales bacterium]|nr:hypothetical protein [Gemmatimonadales bacterium]